ncbi:MAG: D-alanyl-D-alanine carboxypeptidase [Bacteroides sp.]|nr:D-alanyl-D-alanine carboxypeptidase [Bacillota bacterium]MCM1393928.1 D-alanyl-D-alanine carboxypeptidase [[Eubacterium] siraeum]MCM1455905.1 D-alanyl-D-alanine carboxypeptidase [Bacteroides sp.]
MKNLKLSLMSISVVAMFVIAAALASFASMATTLVADAATDFKGVGKSAYLMDYGTGTVIYSRNENERLPIASMMKIMTALLTFEAVERGDVTLDDDVAVSENAASMGGSQVFLDADTTHKLGDLLRTVIVASANDSCVALAEHIEGSVGGFVAKMNARAKELGMVNTSFKNCTGLPAAEAYSSAKDVSIMFAELLKYPKYFDYAKVWLEDYEHPDGRKTTITNTNKLVKFYEGCDGGKTGYTNEAKFCLSATAMRQNMRVIAVIIGADSSKIRNAAVSAMFDYAFANYSNQILLKAGENVDNDVEVLGGKQNHVALTVERDVAQFMSRQDSGDYELKYDLPSNVKAPVKLGDKVGKVYLVKDGVIVSETNVVANETVERMSLFDAIGIIGKHWSTQVK